MKQELIQQIMHYTKCPTCKTTTNIEKILDGMSLLQCRHSGVTRELPILDKIRFPTLLMGIGARRLEVAHSFVTNWVTMLEAGFGGQPLTVKDTSNASQTVYFILSTGYGTFSIAGGSGNALFGIQLGTGSATPAPADYKLATLIANGTSPTQLQYGAMTVNPHIVVGDTSTLSWIRPFTNNSGSSVTVVEMGTVVLTYYASSGFYMLICHDLVTPNQTILNTAAESFQYIYAVNT